MLIPQPNAAHKCHHKAVGTGRGWQGNAGARKNIRGGGLCTASYFKRNLGVPSRMFA